MTKVPPIIASCVPCWSSLPTEKRGT